MQRRVVITGMGAITPVGLNVEEMWQSMLAGKGGTGLITKFDTTEFVTKFAAEIKGFDPLDHFDTKNLLQILASIRGNIYGLSELEALKFLDIRLPRKLQRHFMGPRFGLEGVRNRLGTNVSRRPHLGTIVKPKVGLAPKEWAEVAYDAFIGGVDFVKDDENLVDQAVVEQGALEKSNVQTMLDVLEKNLFNCC